MNRSNFPWPAAFALAVAALALTCAVSRAERPTPFQKVSVHYGS